MISYDIRHDQASGASSSNEALRNNRVSRQPKGQKAAKANEQVPATVPQPKAKKTNGKEPVAAKPAAVPAAAPAVRARAPAPARSPAPARRATAPAPAPTQAPAPAPTVMPAPGAEGAAASGELAAFQAGSPPGQEPPNQLAACFFTTFKSGLDSPPFECTQEDMTSARSCLNGENPQDDILMILMI